MNCAKNRNSFATRTNAEKYLFVADTYRAVSCLRFGANALYP